MNHAFASSGKTFYALDSLALQVVSLL